MTMSYTGRRGKAGPTQGGKGDTAVKGTAPELSVFHETKLRTGLGPNRAQQLIAELRITAGYKPAKKSLNSYLSHVLSWVVFLFG